MMNRLVFPLIILIFSCSLAGAQEFTPKDFDDFTTMRIGRGEPIYWYCVGEIYEYPSGKLIAKVEGIDTARVVKAESGPTKKLQLSRKIFFYRDPAGGQILRQWNGKKVEPIAYPYQKITYELKDGRIRATVVQGKQPRVQTIESAGTFHIRRFGSTTIFSTPLFLDLPSYKAYENYDFFFNPKATGSAGKYQLTWNRRGSLPPFFGGGDSVFQLVSYRVDRYRDLPASMREALESDGRLWMSPPKDLAEIEELQKP